MRRERERGCLRVRVRERESERERVCIYAKEKNRASILEREDHVLHIVCVPQERGEAKTRKKPRSQEAPMDCARLPSTLRVLEHKTTGMATMVTMVTMGHRVVITNPNSDGS